jgi:uncharacterized SAM-binding protein YcdF (DUF218 family)
LNLPNRIADGPWLPKPIHPTVATARRVGWRLLVVALVLGLLVALHRPILTAYAGWFRIDDPVASDLVVLLLGGSDHRPRRAAELVREGYGPKVVYCTSGETNMGPAMESEITRTSLTREGVPEAQQVQLPDVVASTFDEAQAVRRYLADHPARRVLVVTSSFHSRRSLWIFQRVLRDLDVEVHVASIPHPSVDRVDWYMRDESLIMYFIETVKTLVYWVRY